MHADAEAPVSRFGDTAANDGVLQLDIEYASNGGDTERPEQRLDLRCLFSKFAKNTSGNSDLGYSLTSHQSMPIFHSSSGNDVVFNELLLEVLALLEHSTMPTWMKTMGASGGAACFRVLLLHSNAAAVIGIALTTL
eukprot:1404918-Amphidinium_carterae.2